MIKTRQTKSGVRYEVRYRDPIGLERSRTFTTKKLAEKYEREQRTEVGKGSWLDPRHGSQTFAEFMDKWLAERHDLRPRTLELYRSLLKRHLKPTFGALTMAKLSASSTAVRSWNAELAREHPATAAKAYRLLHQLCSTAVADGVALGDGSFARRRSGGEQNALQQRGLAAAVRSYQGHGAWPFSSIRIGHYLPPSGRGDEIPGGGGRIVPIGRAAPCALFLRANPRAVRGRWQGGGGAPRPSIAAVLRSILSQSQPIQGPFPCPNA